MTNKELEVHLILIGFSLFFKDDDYVSWRNSTLKMEVDINYGENHGYDYDYEFSDHVTGKYIDTDSIDELFEFLLKRIEEKTSEPT